MKGGIRTRRIDICESQAIKHQSFCPEQREMGDTNDSLFVCVSVITITESRESQYGQRREGFV